MTTETSITTISDQFSAVWALIQPLPQEQRIQAQDAIIRAYEHATDNIQALLTLTDEISAQRDNAIKEIAYIQKHRGHISYDDVARDMSLEIDDLTYEDARHIVDVLTGQSDANTAMKANTAQTMAITRVQGGTKRPLGKRYSRAILPTRPR